MSEPVKAKFRKINSSVIEYVSSGYYTSQKDFENRNPTLFFVELTNKTKPIPVKKRRTT